MYTVLVFSLDLYEGKVLCIRPQPGNGHTLEHTGIHMLGHTIKVYEGGGGGRQSCTHAAIRVWRSNTLNQSVAF